MFEIAIAALSTIAFAAPQIALIALNVFVANELGLSLSVTVTIFATGSLLFLFGSPFWGNFSERNGRVLTLAIGLVGLLVSLAILGALFVFPFATPELNQLGLLVSRLVYGLVASAIAPVAQAIQVDQAKQHGSIRKAMLVHSLSLSLGRIFGLSAIAHLSDHVTELLVVMMISISVLIALSFSYVLRRPRQNLEFQPFNFLETLSVVPQIKWVFAGGILFTCLIEALNSSLPVSIQASLGKSSLEAAELMSEVLLACAFLIFAMQIFGRTALAENPKLILATGLLSLGLGTIQLILLRSQLDLWLALLFISIGIAFIPPVYLTALYRDCAPQFRGTRAGAIAFAHTLGGGIGALIFASILNFRKVAS